MTTETRSDGRGAGAAVVAHATRAERAERGRAARKSSPRSAHAALPTSRADPIALLAEQAASRIPDLVPIRHGRMLASPFAFFRGAALVMASDLADTPVSGIRVQACGDAHLANFGGFGSPERRLLFDINDFDETLPGPWEWDVKRLATSFEVAGRENGHSEAERRANVLRCVGRYRQSMREFAAMGNLAVWYASMDVERMIGDARGRVSAKALRRAERNVAKARTRDSLQALGKLAEVVDGVPRIRSAPPLVERLEDLYPAATAGEVAEWAHLRLREYRQSLQPDRRRLLEQFQVADVARKVVGVGSVGTRCLIVLMVGRDEGDPLFLQVKEAQASVLERFAGRSAYRSQGRRVVEGQRLSQAASDIFLGYQRARGDDGVERDFYWRQLRDWKASAELDGMEPAAMGVFAELCAWTLARAHARSGDRIAIAAYLGGGDAFDRAVAEFAAGYADLNVRDHAALADAVADGRMEARTGV